MLARYEPIPKSGAKVEVRNVLGHGIKNVLFGHGRIFVGCGVF